MSDSKIISAEDIRNEGRKAGWNDALVRAIEAINRRAFQDMGWADHKVYSRALVADLMELKK